ncbi:MAG: hypothetical protein DRP22_02955 [Verrucomicrobia bacterium]|nr:MAG: hypothetical protein DRP22_02955 [Verrucomicrobiota bacterium]
MSSIATVVIIAIFLVMILYSFAHFPWPVTLLVGAVPFFLLLASSIDFFLLMPIALSSSFLFIPGMPGNFFLYHVFIAAYIFLRVVRTAFTKRLVRQPPGLDSWLVLFLVGWVVMLMVVRGAGMRILGGGKYGGATYLQIVLVLIFYWFSRDASVVSERRIRVAGVLLGILGVLPMTANAVFILTAAKIWQPMLFFKMAAAATEAIVSEIRGEEMRWVFLAPASQLIWAGIFGFSSGRFSVALRWLCFGTAAVAGLLSGYRSVVIGVIGFITLYYFLRARRKGTFLFAMILMGGAAYLFCWTFGRYMPFAVQRVLTLLPGIDVSPEAYYRGLSTIIWRKMVWRLAVGDIPRYWLIGRGVSFSPEALPIDARHHTVELYYLTGNFHQAILELIVLYGVPALVACLGFYAVRLLRMFRETSDPSLWHSASARDWGQALLAYATVRFVLTVAGGISHELLVTLPLYLAFYNIIRNTDARLGAHENRSHTSKLEQRR